MRAVMRRSIGGRSYPMIFEVHPLGAYEANCYIIGCPKTKLGAVVDPGAEPGLILSRIKDLGLTIKHIINTHGHVDHIGANARVKEATGAEIIIHADDAAMLAQPSGNLSAMMGQTIVSPPAGRLVKDGDQITMGEISIRVIHTPGHTRGGICLDLGDRVITGDTLFAGSIGRTDFPGGNYETLIRSIKDKLLILDESTCVWPGHGSESTIGDEKSYNPFLRPGFSC